MSTTLATIAAPVQARTATSWRAIAIGGMLAGVGDITQAFVCFGLASGATPFRILQSIARGYYGAATYQMGWRSAGIGFVTHFFIALSAAAVYNLAARASHSLRSEPAEEQRAGVQRPSPLIEHWVSCGLLYGLCVFAVMYFVVMPLSAAGWPALPFAWATWLTGPLGHPLLVGLPIAWAARRYRH